MRKGLVGDHLLGTGVGVVEIADRLHKLRIGPRSLEGQPSGESFFHAHLQRVIPRITGRLGDVDVAEVRVGAKQLRSRDVLTGQSGAGEFRKSEEGIAHYRAQEINHRLIALVTGRMILDRDRIYVEEHVVVDNYDE